MTLSEKDRQELIKHYIEKTQSTIEDIKFFIENEKLLVAINRIYYGIFYMLSALAIKHQMSTSKHTQLIGWFNKNFIKSYDFSIKRLDGKFRVSSLFYPFTDI